MRLLLFTLVVLITDPAAAQVGERPLPTDRPVGIVYPSEVGRMTGRSPEQDALHEAVITEVEQSLRRLGYQVLPRTDVIQQLVETTVDCEGGVGHCSPSTVLQALQLGAVVLVAIGWDRSPADLSIEVTTGEAVGNAKGTLGSEVSTPEVAVRVPELVVAALEDLKNGKAANLIVHSVPVGAEVQLDGVVVGVAPVSANVRPGEHEVIVRYPDHVTTAKHFKVERGVRSLRVDVTMQPVAGRAVPTQRLKLSPPTKANPAWDYALAGGLTLAAVALAISPVQTLARSGECEEARRGSCTPVRFGWQPGVMLGASALALGSAVYVMAATPIAASMTYDGERGTLRVSGRF